MQVKGGKGEENGHRNNSRRRNAVQGAETSSVIWRVAGVGNVQVDVISCRKKWWGEGVKKRCVDDEQLLMGGIRTEEGTNNYPETDETGGADEV